MPRRGIRGPEGQVPRRGRVSEHDILEVRGRQVYERGRKPADQLVVMTREGHTDLGIVLVEHQRGLIPDSDLGDDQIWRYLETSGPLRPDKRILRSAGVPAAGEQEDGGQDGEGGLHSVTADQRAGSPARMARLAGRPA